MRRCGCRWSSRPRRVWIMSGAFGRSHTRRRRAVIVRPGRGTRIVVNDRMQRGYVYYLTEPPGRNFAAQFRPELTPQQMLRLGVFGGKYMTDCRAEFPAAWFARAKLSPRRRER